MNLRFILAVVGSWFLVTACGSGGKPNGNQTQGGVYDFSGNWQMSQIQDQELYGAATCSPTTVSITQSTSSLTVGSYTLQCTAGSNNYTSGGNSWDFSIQGGNLSYQGIPAGTIGSNYIHISMPLSGNNGASGTLSITIDPSGSSFTYKESLSSTWFTQAQINRE